MGVQRPEVHQLDGQFVVVLQGVDQRRRIDAKGVHFLEHQAQEFGVAGQQGVLVGRAGDEVVGQVGTALGHLRDVVQGQVELLEAETAGLADHAADQLVADDRQRVALGPGTAAGAGFHAEKAVGIQAQAAGTQAVQRVQGVADDHLLGGEAGVEPVQGWLAFLEVMQVHPAPGLAVDPGDGRGGAPVGFLDPGFEEDHPLQLTDDVVARLELVAHRRRQVHGIAAFRHLGQQRPVLLTDLDHVVEPGVGTVGQLGQAKVRALAGVRGDQVVDGHGIVRGGQAAHLHQLLLGAVERVDVKADAVEVTVDARGEVTPAHPARLLDGAGVDALHTNLRQAFPQRFMAEGGEHRAAFGGDDRVGVDGQPYRGDFRGAAWLGFGVGVLPQA